MGVRAVVATEWWKRSWEFRRLWHRYRVEGMEHFHAVGGALMVGYHGRPVAHDLCMLQVGLLREGVRTHAVMHEVAKTLPVVRHALGPMGFVFGDGPEVEAALAEGRKIIVTPGGTRESARRHDVRYQVDWGGRTGWLRLALKHRVPVLPVGAWGVDDTYVGLVNGADYIDKIKLPGGLPPWLGVGPLGLWPFSPPFPVQITSVIAPPYTRHLDTAVDPGDKRALGDMAREVEGIVQGILDRRPS
ncbi:MAG: 1-acyl-sn-glycerol-3-phosphate acyltransferase [Deltaproteobacteria bacterium]|nr:1-acyl-sn-glycerol-3-phosphate acyltransferase [Deltaproteobacteria bacterium]